MASIPRTPSPPSSPAEARTPLLSGGSTHHPWDTYPPQPHLHLAYSPITPRYPIHQVPSPATPHAHHAHSSQQQSPVHSPSGANNPSQSQSQPLSQLAATAVTSPPPVSSPTPTPIPTSTPTLFLTQPLEPSGPVSETWQTLYPSEIASFSPGTLRSKLTQSNSLLARLSSSLSEARAQAAHFTFQHQLLTIETAEALQRHKVEHDIAKREVEVLRGVGGGGGGGSASGIGGSGVMTEYQKYCWALEEELAGHKRKLKRTRALLRETKEEVLEVKGENEMLRRRIGQIRKERMREFGGEEVVDNDESVKERNGYGGRVGANRVKDDLDEDDEDEDDDDDDETYFGDQRGGTKNNSCGYSVIKEPSSGPPTPTPRSKKLHHHHHHHHHHAQQHQQQATPQPSSSMGHYPHRQHHPHHSIPPPSSPPSHPYAYVPQTPLSRPPPRRNNAYNPNSLPASDTSTSSDALTTLGLLASQVLSQEGFPADSDSHAYLPRVSNQTTQRRARTPPHSLPPHDTISHYTSVPSTPISQARNHPGPGPKQHQSHGKGSRNTTKTRTPNSSNYRVAGPNNSGQSKSTTITGHSNYKNSATLQTTSHIQIHTPKYTSPISITAPSAPPTIPTQQIKLQNNKKRPRRLSSDSTLSLSPNHDEDRIESANSDFEVQQDREEQEVIQHLLRTGSPVPVAIKKGKVLGGNGGYVYSTAVGNGTGTAKGSIVRGERRYNKRTRTQK